MSSRGASPPPRFARMRDGRQLAYEVWGDRHGAPILYFTGGQSSRLDGEQWDERAEARGLRLITCDRPGVGRSDPKPDRTLLDWPADVADLADALDLDRFAVVGLSGGGPHALVTAHALDDRVSRAAVVSGAGAWEMPERTRGLWWPLRVMYRLARHSRGALRAALEAQRRQLQRPDYAERVLRGLDSADARWARRDPDGLQAWLAAAREGYALGVEGDLTEWCNVYARPWGFPLESVRVPVRLWYGSEDRQAPVRIGRWLAQSLPSARLIERADTGHLSSLHDHVDEILGWLSALPAGTRASSRG